MEKIYKLNGYALKVSFEEKLIRISTPGQLWQFLSKNIKQRSATFVNLIKADYLDHFGKELKISNKSFIIEIWAHVFAGYLARAIRKLIKMKLIERTANFIIDRSDVIDCGERSVDSNRIYWDLLAPFLPLIFFFIPRSK